MLMHLCTAVGRWCSRCSRGQWSLHVCDTGLASGVRLSVGPAVCSGAPAVGRLRGIICTGVTRTCSFAVVSATCAETRTVTEMHTISSHTSLEGVGGACTPSLTSAISSCGRRWISTKHTKPERQCGKNGHVERLAVWRQSAATRLHCCGESPSSRVAQCAAVGICVKARGGGRTCHSFLFGTAAAPLHRDVRCESWHRTGTGSRSRRRGSPQRHRDGKKTQHGGKGRQRSGGGGEAAEERRRRGGEAARRRRSGGGGGGGGGGLLARARREREPAAAPRWEDSGGLSKGQGRQRTAGTAAAAAAAAAACLCTRS